MKAKVRATSGFKGKFDSERSTKENKVYPNAGDEWITTVERAEFLKNAGAVEIVEIIKEEVPKIENIEKTMERIEESAKETVETEKKKTTRKRTSKK